MKNLLNNLLKVTLTLAPLAAQAEIMEVNKINAVLPLIRPNTLVVFDIDNTLLAPDQTLGSDQWFGYLVEQNKACGMNEARAVDAAISKWVKVQKKTKTHTIERDTAAVIQQLHRRGIVTMGLTARPLNLDQPTLAQLFANGVNGFHAPSVEDAQLQLPRQTKMTGGAIFVGPHLNKGTVLREVLVQNRMHFDRIVFVDDKAKHVSNVEAALKSLPTEYIGLRYGAADREVKAFNAHVANRQWAQFKQTGTIASDKEVPSTPGTTYDCAE